MRRRRGFLGLSLLIMLGFSAQSASADPFSLFQWVFNIDGKLYDSAGVLGSAVLPLTFSGTPSATAAQGLITVAVTGAGAHHFAAFYDYELDQSINGFSNEYGAPVNLLAKLAGLSWEIDEPGFVFGDIYDHIQLGAAFLDNSNAVPSVSPDDVSVALGWQFDLSQGGNALISFIVSETAPTGGFYIGHLDASSGRSLYYSTSLSISNPPPVPEPTTAVLMLTGLGLAGAARRLRRRL